MRNDVALRAPVAPAPAPSICASDPSLRLWSRMPVDIPMVAEAGQATRFFELLELPVPTFGSRESETALQADSIWSGSDSPTGNAGAEAWLVRKSNGLKSNWRTSVVDTMKLLVMDSSLANRKKLAMELGYTGKPDGSSRMNIWLRGKIIGTVGQFEKATSRHTDVPKPRPKRVAPAVSPSSSPNVIAEFKPIPPASMLLQGQSVSRATRTRPEFPVPEFGQRLNSIGYAAQEEPAVAKPDAVSETSPVSPAPTPPEDQSGSASQEFPAAVSAHRINPTGRTLRFVVPVTDGPVYLGDVILAVAPDDGLSVQADRLLQMLEPLLRPEVFARLRAAADENSEIPATQLAQEQIALNYDSEKLALAIGIPVPARRPSALSLRNTAASGISTLEPAAFSGFINFRSSFDVVERGTDEGFAAPVSLVEGAVRAFGIVAETEGYLSARKDDPLLRRTGSRLVYDDLKHVVRFSAGDVQPFSRSFQSTPAVAGISAQRLYNELEPWREFRSTGSQGFTIFAPSTVDTIVNGRSVERKLLQPGSYTLQDFPLAEGANEVRLQIQDAAGKMRTVEFNLYSNRDLLEPGITEFSAFAGVYSNPTGTGIAYTDDWASSGFIRMGISQQLTAGLNFQADGDAQQIGGEILFGSGLGLVGFDLSASRRAAGDDGFAVAVSYEKVVQSQSADRSMSMRALVEYRSPEFATPGALTVREPSAFRAAAGWTMTLGRDTYISADMQYSRDRMARTEAYNFRLSGGLGITDTLAFVAETEWEKARNGENGGTVRIGIRKRFGPRATAQTEFDSRGVMRASYQSSGGSGIGTWSGSVDVNRTPEGTDLNAQGSLLTNRFELGLTQFGGYSAGGRGIRDMRTSLRVGTSIAFADGVFAIGRPIQQAFLIAEPHRSLQGKTVNLDPQEDSEQARSGRLGGAVTGTLSAYSPRTLIYEVPEAPPGYDLGAGNVQIAPPYKSGYLLEIGSDYHLMVIGRLLDRNDEPVSLLAGKAIDLEAPKRPAITMFTSRGGKFGAQGLRPGKWRIEMPTEPPTIYEIDITDDPSGIVRIGDIRPLQVGVSP